MNGLQLPNHNIKIFAAVIGWSYISYAVPSSAYMKYKIISVQDNEIQPSCVLTYSVLNNLSSSFTDFNHNENQPSSQG